MKIEQTPALHLLPRLRMVPKLMAVNAILVLPLQALEARIEVELDNNPALERESTLCPRCGMELAGVLCSSCGHLLGEPLSEDPTPPSPRTEGDEDFDPLALLPAELSLHEHLLLQLHAQRLQGRRREIGEFLVGSIDERGYLQADLGEVAKQFRVSRRVVEEVLGVIQGFDPPGVGGRSVEECLLLQLRVLEPTPENLLARRVIEAGSLVELGRGQYGKVARRLGCTPQEVRQAHAYLCTSCYPYPADRYEAEREGGGRRRPEEVPRPDVIIVRTPRGYAVEVAGSPTMGLRLNPLYRDLYQQVREQPQAFAPHAQEHIRDHVNRARLFIETVKRRNWTLRKIFEVIVAVQREFLDRGPRFLNPLTLAEVAARLGISESTVSRALDGKYVQLPDGRIVSSHVFFEPNRPIKERVRQLVAQEDPRQPLTDQTIAALLRREGIHVARRTVAKYREELGIPSSAVRRRRGTRGAPASRAAGGW
ncbi:MAG: RNA polymerase factor sigma-54 [Armatimonadota bacterium]|nr:RNA polymerase factor sigma-54 [Armatimonadota bacterium]MDR7439337.1 RNA polymerase factor sigma-54 [Armatimonadota bacterium]MDR7562027.1 RNA polymerase factor sigma-54 [Armatimonadota bacterium]MDR7566999.1 RNA polymerase factor sigma-54 [Armatimonadota bacterium]MDR7601146.1 RNA polymerase factor sigma-54 [Armatimonadota bacterium]